MDIKLFLLLFIVYKVESQNPCCEKNNVINISSRLCIEDNHTINLSCPLGYVKYIIDSNDTTNDTYCFTHFDDPDSKIEKIACGKLNEQDGLHNLIKDVTLPISISLLTLTLIIYLIFPQIIDSLGYLLIQSFITLDISYIILIIINNVTFNDIMCIVMGYMAYWSFLLTFTWYTVISIFISNNNKLNKIIISVLVYLFSFTVIGIVAIFDFIEGDHFKPNIGQGSCWFSSRNEVLIFFYLPITCLITINFVIYMYMIVVKYRKSICNHKNRIYSTYIKIFVLTGMFYIFESISFYFEGKSKIWDNIFFITDIINSLQGLWIFIICVLQKSVLKTIFRKFKTSEVEDKGAVDETKEMISYL